jgi:hypothetical protein
LSELLYFRLPAEHEFMKPNVVFHGQSEDQLEEMNEVSPPSSSSCSPHSQTGARTVQQEEGNDKEGEESLLSPKVEPIESDDEEGDNLTTDETNSPQPPVNGPYFVIAESDCESEEEETVDCVDQGSLAVMNVANQWVDENSDVFYTAV